MPELPTRALHSLAARWAAKEAFIKAWSCALFGSPPLLGIDEVDWREIEVIHDEWDRPAIALHGGVARACETSLGAGSTWRVLVSISHDGPCAIAHVVIADASTAVPWDGPVTP